MTERRYLQSIYMIKDLYPEPINFQNSMIRERAQEKKMGKRVQHFTIDL